MITEKYGKVVKGLGGLYVTRALDLGKIEYISCYAKGVLKRDDEKVLIGDNVKLLFDDSTPDSVVISEVISRTNSLIRPPMANLDYLFITLAVKKPSPVIETVDKLISIAEHNKITPVIVLTKSDLSCEIAHKIASVYEKIGFPTFITSSEGGEGLDALKAYINDNVRDGRTAAFAGASGVGKSTLMNALFPSLSLATSEISRKIERGRHTTRHVEIFDINNSHGTGYLADTPGFSLIDFARFDFFSLDELADTFREFHAYKNACRYQDCAHVGEGEDECAIMRAAKCGEIPMSRLESYRSIYRVLKSKASYD